MFSHVLQRKITSMFCFKSKFLEALPDKPEFALKEIEIFKFDLFNNFEPTVAFQFTEYIDYSSTRYTYVFIEQKLTTFSDKLSDRVFQRRYQAYSFYNLDSIINQTETLIWPSFVKKIPKQLEITGIFNWKCM